jgi:uncharacterized protein YkwD
VKRLVFVCAAALALAGCASDLTARYPVTSTSIAEAEQAAALISAYRVSKGLSPVTVDSRLNQAALHQAKAVAAAGELDHGDFGSRMEQYAVMGHSAENLAAGSATIEGTMGQWKASLGHNRNLLLPQARKIGLARAASNSRYKHYWALVLGQ